MSETDYISGAERLAEAEQLLVFAGSGLSAESGVPTFRGERGAYSDPRILKYTLVETFHHARVEMMRWYDERRRELRKVWPNPAHYALGELALAIEMTIATQNVDGLLQQALVDEGAEAEVIELHGSLAHDQCHHCRHVFEASVTALADEPSCRVCKGPLRPAVTWFGETLPTGTYESALEKASRADVCLIVGTSGLVYPAAEIPQAARDAGAFVIEVNPNESELSEFAHTVLRDTAAVALPRLVAGLQEISEN